jgi:hypothetical protein
LRHTSLVGTLLLVIGCATSRQDGEADLARYRHCGLEYALPAALRLSVDSTSPESGAWCTITADPETRSPDDLSDLSALTINVYRRGFEEVAADAGFEHREEGWVVLGRHAISTPADTVSGEGWHGLEGAPMIGRFSEEGYAGLDEVYRAVLTDGRTAAVLDATFEASDAITAFLASLRFRR